MSLTQYSKTMQTANQNMAVGCIMILFALGFGIVSVLHENRREAIEIETAVQKDIVEILQVTNAMDALHQAIHYAVCTMKRIHWSTDDLIRIIQETVHHAMNIHQTNSSIICPIIHQ